MALAELPLKHKPEALISSASTLLPGLKAELEQHFSCPVIDVYSMNESRFIAYDTGESWAIAPHDLFIEILDKSGQPCAPGVRGEIVLTGGRNPFLPLLRYRTGDFAALDFTRQTPSLVEFSGRPPVYFLATDGRIVPSLDINNALRQFPLAEFSLHQHSDRTLTLQIRGRQTFEDEITGSISKLFGAEQELQINEIPPETTGKLLPFTSEIGNLRLSINSISFS